MCGDPGHATRFAFVEFASIEGAMNAITLNNITLGKSTLRISFSKTAIQSRPPLNIQQKEQVDRTVHVGYVDVQVRCFSCA